MSLSTRDTLFICLSVFLGCANVGCLLLADNAHITLPLMEKCLLGKENGVEIHPYLQLGILDNWHCMMTQIFYDAARYTPGGTLTGMATFIAAMPWLVFVSLESARSGAKGLIRYPMLAAGTFQMGASTMLLLLYIPFFIWGRSKDQSPLSKGFVLGSSLPPLVYLGLAGATFFASTDTYVWIVSASVLGGWGVIFVNGIPGLFSGANLMEKEESSRFATVPYIVTGTVAFIAWLGVVLIMVFQTGADFKVVFDLIWKEASSGVRFFLVDVVGIWIASVLVISYLNQAVLKELMVLCALFGPGAGVAMVHAGLQVENLEVTPSDADSKKKKN